jgi:hypothetical protein
MRWALAAGATAAALGLAGGPALAQIDLFSLDAISGQIDARLAAADGERAWVDGGFGKIRFSGAGNGWRGHARIASADLVWRPSLAWDITGYVDAVAQPGQRHGVDLSEAYLTYKPLPRGEGAIRYSARLGLLYPAISMENDGPAWTPSRTITASAIDSWVGEEVKPLAAEVTLSRRWARQEVSATAAIFVYDDTAATLLSWRGWSLGDVRATAFGDLPIPQVPIAHKAFSVARQAPFSQSLDELDGRPGVYARAEWRTPWAVTANLFYYDNAGDRRTVIDRQWSWETVFWDAGLRWKPDTTDEVLAQAMTGRTVAGFLTPVGWRVDASFDAAYVLVSRQVGHDLVTARLDAFDVRDHTFQAIDNNDERGWAIAADYRRPLGRHLIWLVEALHVDSNRPARAYVGENPYQAQTLVQTALRLAF